MPDLSFWLSLHIWSSRAGCYSPSGPGIIGPLCTFITKYHHIIGGRVLSKQKSSTIHSLPLSKRDSLSHLVFSVNIDIGFYRSHLWATMQLKLISFVLIILHCMDYTGCQQHNTSRHWQHKREYKHQHVIRNLKTLTLWYCLTVSLQSLHTTDITITMIILTNKNDHY